MALLGEFLVGEGYISEAVLSQLPAVAREMPGEALLPELRRSGLIEQRRLAEALARFYRLEMVAPDEWPRREAAAALSLPFLREHRVFPIADDGTALRLAMEDPGNRYAIDAVRVATGRPVLPAVATSDEIDAALERASGVRDDDTRLEVRADTPTEDVELLKDLALETPVIRLVNELIENALHSRATDIHVEPFDGKLAVRVRVDGLLRAVRSPPLALARAIVSRIKILAGLDIAERRLPQDGRAHVRVGGRALDLRVATIPTIHGEAVAIRLLENVRRSLDLARLGFSERDRSLVTRHLASPHGMIVVTGPTGSGKTTTLATALSMLNQGHRKILTIEDPIEYEIEGVNQTQARPAIGLTFASAMRSFLRHDPDVIMVGEMRDQETASIGVNAALTGHLVLTTLHTNTAAGSIARLLDMGVDGFLLASSLRCVVGQRLVRQLCTACRRRDDDPELLESERKALVRLAGGRPIELWRGDGCERCYGSGYADRTIIAEVLAVDADVRSMIGPHRSADEIEAVARKNGMTTMWDDGLLKCLAGSTTVEEIRRAVIEN